MVWQRVDNDIDIKYIWYKNKMDICLLDWDQKSRDIVRQQ